MPGAGRSDATKFGLPFGCGPAGSWFNEAMANVRKRLDRYLRKKPALGRGVYIAPGAVVVGDVAIGEKSSVWYNAVLRGDINRIVVGHHTNIQDAAVLHVADDYPCRLGNYVTVGHGAIIHACTVGDQCLIGMGAAILDGAVIGRQCLIGARALITPGTRVPPGSLVVGAPARVVRKLTGPERARIRTLAEKYVENAAYYRSHRIQPQPPLGCPDLSS